MEKEDTVCLNLSMLFRGTFVTPAIGGEWLISGAFQVKPHRYSVGHRDPTPIQDCW